MKALNEKSLKIVSVTKEVTQYQSPCVDFELAMKNWGEGEQNILSQE